MAKKIKTGLVLGKFMPFHQGHELLIRFAQHYVNRLFVVVDKVPDARYKDKYIPGPTRVNWIKQTFPGVEVFYISKITPQEPSEHPDFWNVWKKILLDLVPIKPDYLFASEKYGFPLAKILRAKFIPVDVDREMVRVSGTAIRKNFNKYWEYLTAAAKKDFMLRICVFGPESTGKTILAKALAKHFKTVFVPEHARVHLEKYIEAAKSMGKEHKIKFGDMLEIAAGQLALEDALTFKANKILVCDTDALMTVVWSRWLFGKADKRLLALAKKRNYDLYLLAKPDIAWKGDDVRYFPKQKERERFFEDCVKILRENKREYEVIGGKGRQRTKNAIRAVERLFKKKFNYRYFVEKLKK